MRKEWIVTNFLLSLKLSLLVSFSVVLHGERGMAMAVLVPG